MSANDILSLIDAEIANLQQARALLVASTNGKLPDRPKKTTLLVAKLRKKRTMSPEGRARIAEAQRKRWAAKKK
jgi:hypothetical protein